MCTPVLRGLKKIENFKLLALKVVAVAYEEVANKSFQI